MPRPAGVTTIAAIFLLCAAYLATLAAIMLTAPGAISMTLGEPLIHDLVLAGPYMFLLMAAAFAGFVMLIPAVSAAAVDLGWPLVWSGLGIIIRMVVVWYLWQAPVAEQFRKRSRPT